MSEQVTQPETATATADSNADDPERVAASVWEDYYDTERSLTEDGFYLWASAKSKEKGYPDQSHIQHIRNGISVLIRLYKELPSETPFLNETTLRRSVATYVAHDHHKRVAEERGHEEEFEISKSDAQEFITKCGLDRIAPSLEPEELRGVMAGHHQYDERALHDAIPRSVLDAYHLVLLADAIASTRSAENIRRDQIQERLTSALGTHSYKIHVHEFDTDADLLTQVVNRAFASLLREEEDWRLLRVYPDGCLYVAPHSDEPDYDALVDRIYDKFGESVAESHIAYADDTIESGGLSLKSQTELKYDISPRDIFYQGIEDACVGVMQQAIVDGENTNDFPKNELELIERNIEPYIDTEIHTATRHIEGLARGIETLYVPLSMVTDENADEEWKQDELRGMLHLFDVDSEENVKEAVSLREENGDMLTAGNATQWNYKYLAAQYVYDEYYDGRDMTRLKKKFKHLIHNRLSEFPNYDEFESEVGVEKIHDELRVKLAREIEVNGDQLLDPTTLEEALNRLVDHTSEECEFCGMNTTAAEDSGFKNDHYLLKETPEIPYKTSDRSDTLDGKTTLCYLCQLEIATRRSHSDDWQNADEDTLFVRMQGDYGYVPLSWRMEAQLRHQMLDPSTLSLKPDEHAEMVMEEGTQPEVFDSRSFPEYQSWSDDERGFEPRESFGGSPTPVADLNDADERYNAITSLMISAVYSGVPIHFTKYPMQNADKRADAFVSFGDEVQEELTFYDGNITLDDARERVEEAITMNWLVDSIGFDGRAPTLKQMFAHADYPGSRLLRMAHERETFEYDDKHAAACVRVDDRFGETRASVELISQSLVTLGYDADDARNRVVSDLLVRGEIDDQTKQIAKDERELDYFDVAAEQYRRSAESAKDERIEQAVVDGVISRAKWRSEE